VNYGALDINGRPLIVPFNAQNRIDVSQDTMNRMYTIINDTSLVSLFQILVDAPQMTATEVLERAQEKSVLLAPATSRLQSEFYSGIIEREIDILDYNGVFPEAPDLLKQTGVEYEIEYSAPINLLQKASTALAAKRFVESIVPLSQFDPNLMLRLDLNEYVKIMKEAEGVKAALVRSDKEYEALLAEKDRQQQIAQMVAAAPDISGSIKNIAEAQSVAA
jgi:hypothetical protein